MLSILLHIGYTEVAAKQHIKQYQQKQFIQEEYIINSL